MSDLLTILNKLESPGTFSVHGTMQSLLPGLYMEIVQQLLHNLNPNSKERILSTRLQKTGLK